MVKRWVQKDVKDDDSVVRLSTALNVNVGIASVLIDRGIDSFESARAFFRPDLENLHDPFLMKGMTKAVLRISKAIQRGEKILVFGDYDVDGTTAVSLLYTYLKAYTDEVFYYIPDRYKEGYGVSKEGIDYAFEIGAELIIALDCGIKAIDQVSYSNSKNIDFIICDHHRPGEVLPEAYAILDPKQEDCTYPYDELSGCAIGFKLAQALESVIGDNSYNVYELLDLVAVSVACDIVPLTGENRILCSHGLKKINSNPRLGLRTLLNENKRNANTVTDLVFTVGPRINAAGRIEHGNKAVELLVNTDEEFASIAGKKINANNAERKDLDKKITLEALEIIKEDAWYSDVRSTVVFDDNWHKGVIGIVASRLIEAHYKPTIVLTEANGKVTGSARSVKGFDIYNAIEACSDKIEQFGGHKYAAGLTLKKENVFAFREKFEQVVSETILPEQLTPEIEVCCELNLEEIDRKFYRIVEQMAPFGPKNMRPVFVTRNVVDGGYTKLVGASGDHIKFDFIQSGSCKRIGGIGFGLGEHIHHIKTGQPFDIVYQLDENEWQGNVSLQLSVKDLKY